MSIDPRLMERRKTVAEDNAKKSVSRLLKFLVIVMVIGAGVWLAFSPWLSVSQVTTSGIEASRTHSVLVDHGVIAGSPMILVNTSAVEHSLRADPWVAEAEVRLDWPDQVVVEVVERVPVAWALTEGGWTRRARDGVAIPSEAEPPADAARIEMPTLTDERATRSTDLLGALEFVATLDRSHHPGTVVTMREDEIWASVSGYEVRLGRSVDMAQKALSLGALLAEEIPAGSTLNLIAPTLPGWTPPTAEEESGEEVSDRGEAESGDSDGDEDGDS